MKKRITSFRFWFSLISIIIITQNVLGWDDKDLLLYLTTPPLLIANEWLSLDMTYFGEFISRLIGYIFNFLSWYLLGLLFDRVLYHLVIKIRSMRKRI